MARLFGFIGNRPELGPKVLMAYSDHLKASGDPLGWGLGFYQFGEPLLRRRPLEERHEIELAKVTESLTTDVLIGHARNPTVGNLRTENTHPFRYRQWLFAQTGTLEGFDGLRDKLVDVQPDFLRPNVRGDTDSEPFFYLILSYLNDLGHLGSGAVPPGSILQALRSAVGRVDSLCDEAGVGHHRGDFLITNGEHLVAVHRSGKMGYRVVDDAREVEQYLEELEDGARISSLELSNLDAVHCCVLASELDEVPDGWQRAPADSILLCSRTEGPAVQPLRNAVAGANRA